MASHRAAFGANHTDNTSTTTTAMDSAGLGEMVHAYVGTKNRGGSLRLLHLTKRIRDLLVVTKLLTVFDAYESEAEALASFGAKLT